MYDIKSIGYTESRQLYFERKLKRLNKSLKWWTYQKPNKQYSSITIDTKCDDIGREIAYITDAMLALSK